MPFEGLIWATSGQMFQVIVESLMSSRVSDLKAPKLQWPRIATDQRSYSTTIAKKLCYGIYDDVGNNLNISSLLKFKFCLTDHLMINEINTVWHVKDRRRRPEGGE
jgi:hypothetical protein